MFVGTGSKGFRDPAAHVRFCVLKFDITRSKLMLP